MAPGVLVGPEVIHEEKDFLVINKPSGWQVHAARHATGHPGAPSTSSKHDTLVDWLVKRYPELKKVGDDPELRPGIVHRLDKDTSGVMLVARTQDSFEYFKSLFQKHEIKKKYLALVVGMPKQHHGVIDAPIGIRSGTLKRSIHSNKMMKEAVTEYRVVKKIGENSLLEVVPKTGRTHQIRVHLASIGHPVIGDRLYGKSHAASRLALHALSLEFTARDGRRLKFEADPPKELSTMNIQA